MSTEFSAVRIRVETHGNSITFIPHSFSTPSFEHFHGLGLGLNLQVACNGHPLVYRRRIILYDDPLA